MKLDARERYSRQILFAGIGEKGQDALSAARVAIVGCGALGSFHADALARAGVGYLRIIDRDFIEASNLQRQWLFDESDADDGSPKATAAAKRLRQVNSSITIEPIVADLAPSNVSGLLEGMQLLLDGTDNFETRYLINDFAVSRSIPWIYGAAVGSYGLKMAVVPDHTACLKCVYPEPPQDSQPTCETAGVLNAVTGAVAALQIGDALRILVQGVASIRSTITTVNVWTGEVRQFEPERDPDCPACGRRDFAHLRGERRAPISLCGRNAVQIHERARPVNLQELAARLAPLGEVRRNELALRFSLPDYQLTVFSDGRAIIKGTTDIQTARSLYAKYVGS